MTGEDRASRPCSNGHLTRRRVAAIGLAALLAGCAGRGTIRIDAAARGGDPRKILVATTRARDPGPLMLSGERSAALGFYDFTVSVPPDRPPGSVTFPRRDPPDPRTDFVTLSAARLDGTAAFRHEVNRRVAALPPQDREAVVFVHGFNTNFAEGLYRQAQLAHDFRNRSISVNYSWPSAANVLAYAADRESALFARNGLEATLAALAETKVPRIVAMAHSMGAHVMMETLRQMAIRGSDRFFDKLAAVVLVAPDIDIDVFRTQAAELAGFEVPIYIFVSSRDSALRFSSLLRGQRERLGSISDAARLNGLNVAVIDLSNVETQGDPLRHFKVASSPTMFALFADMGSGALDSMMRDDVQPGLISGGIQILTDAKTTAVPR